MPAAVPARDSLMRVLVLSATFPSSAEPTRGVFIFERIRRLAERCEVVVVAPVPWFPFNRWIRRAQSTLPATETVGGLTVHHPRVLSIPRYGKFLDGALYALGVWPFAARLRRRFPFDVIDAHFEYPDAVAGTLLGRLLGSPVVVTLRGKLIRAAGYRLHRPQLRWMLERADRVVAVSDYLKRAAEGLGIPGARVRVIRNGVDKTRFAPMDRAEARRRCGLPTDRPILLTVGGVEAHKGQHTVVESLPELLRHHPDLLYVLVGAGHKGDSFERDLRRSVERLGLGEHVLFAGRRPHAELSPWFAAADLFVLLTKSEGWPNVILESLACGLPVVATRVGGVPEIARDGQDGILVPYQDAPAFRDAVLKGLATDWDREAMVRYAHSLDWNQVVDDAFAELCAAASITDSAAASGGAPKGPRRHA